MKYLFCLLILLSSSAIAQKMKRLSGDFKKVKGQKSFAIRFTYDSLIVGTGTPEREYLTQMKSRWDEKEPGKGKEFVAMWFDDRKNLYEPAFIESFEQYSKVKVGDEQAPYTIVIKTTRTEGGWNLGVIMNTADIDGELWIVETADPGKVIAKMGFYKFRGKSPYGGDFEMSGRISSAYTLAGHGTGDFLKRKSR